MPQKIENKDIFSSDFLEPQKKSFKELIELIKQMELELKDVLKVQQDLVKTSDKKSVEGLKQRKRAVEGVNKVAREMQNLEKQKVRLNKQLQAATDKEVAGKLRLQRANKEQRDRIKAEIILKDKLAGTEEKLLAKNNLLRLARKKLNTETRKGRIALKQINKEIDRNNRKIDKNSDRLKRQKRNVGNYASALKGVGSALRSLGLAVGIGAALRNIVGIFSGFQKEAANLASVLGKSRGEIKVLTEDAKRLGASTSFTAKEVIKLQTAFAKLGFKEDEILNATEATLSLAAATGTELDRAAEVAASTIRGFGLEASDTQMVVDVMAKSFSTSSLDMEKFATAMAAVAPAAKAAGVNVQRTTALLGTITDAGIDASTAGTALRNIFLDLSKSGLTFEEAMTEIRNASDKNAVALDLFGKRGAVVAQVLADGGEKAEELEKGLNSAGGAAKKMADEQLDTLSGRTKLMTSAWEGFILSLEDGEGIFAQVANTVVEGITNMLSKMADLGKSNLQLINETKDKAFQYQKTVAGINKINREIVEIQEKSDEALKKIIEKGGDAAIFAESELKLREKGFTSTERQISNIVVLNRMYKSNVELLEKDLALKKAKFHKTKDQFSEEEKSLILIGLQNKQLEIERRKGARAATKEQVLNRIKIATEQELLKLSKFRGNTTTKIIAGLAAKELQRRKDVGEVIDENTKKIEGKTEKELTGLQKLKKELTDINKLKSDELVLNGDTTKFQRLSAESKELKNQIDFLEAKLKLEEDGFKAEKKGVVTDISEITGEEDIREQANKELEGIEADTFESLDAIIKKEEEAAAKEQKILEDRLNALKEFTQKAIDIANEKTDKEIEAVDKELDANKSRQEQLEQLAAQGNLTAQQSLSAEIKREVELERQKAALEKKKARRQIFIEGLDLLSSKIDSGEKDAVTSTLNDMTRLLGALAALPGFYEGTETTVGDALGNPTFKGRDGYVVRVDGAEKILNPSMSARTGNMTTEEITKAAEMYSAGMFDQDVFIKPKVASLHQPYQDNQQILKKFDSLESTIKNKPILSDLKFDDLSKALIITVEQNGDLKRTHYKLKK